MMVRRVNLVDFSNLLFYAESIGISWNTAHEILVKDEICPMYERNSCDYDFTDFVRNDPTYGGAYSCSDETMRIVVGFMVKEDLSDITVVND
jgi:hypothetical protein